MIEDKKLGLKIAENPAEAKWETIRSRASEAIEQHKTEIEINSAIVRLADEKLKELRKGRGKYIG